MREPAGLGGTLGSAVSLPAVTRPGPEGRRSQVRPMPEGGSPDVTQLVDRAAVPQSAAVDVSAPVRPMTAAALARAQQEQAASRRARLGAVVKAYVSLTKPRI